MKKYLFIDRDGTLVKEPYDYQVDKLSKVRLVEGVIPSLLKLKEAGFTFIMVSNQDGLGTDSFPLKKFTKVHEFILELFASQGIYFEEILICPHKPQDNCSCRKPKLGLVEAYLNDHTWDREHSYFIGDRETDLQMAHNMGIGAFQIKDESSWSETAQSLTAKKERVARVSRHTKETQINLLVNLDRSGDNHFDTGLGFFNHMLDQIATHANIHLEVKVTGDLEVDCHHTIEDTALALGQALKEALGDKRGICRFGFCLPMDEVYAKVFEDKLNQDGVEVSLDISGRPYHVLKLENLTLKANFTDDKVGQMPVQMVGHFFSSLATTMGLSLYMEVSEGNCHHQVEALFKAFGRALRQALKVEGNTLPSSKGTL